jgi:nucleoside-diphosphate-sugar epimerase
MNRILVTGGTGFIGRHCLPLLVSSGYEVHATVRNTPSEPQQDVKWHSVDLLDQEQVKQVVAKVRPTHLLHLAWYAIPGKYWTSLENLSWLQSSIDLLNAFVDTGGQRAVIAGTCAEYDWRYGYCSEELTPLVPRTLYGASKHSLQVVVSALTNQSGLSAAWGRLFFLFGPHEHPSRLMPSVIRALLDGKPAACSHGEQIRDFLYVKDAAAAFVALLDSAVIGSVNIASGQPRAIRDIVYTVGDILGRCELIQLGVIPTKPGEPPALLADVARLRGEVGWSPKYNLSDALSETVDWWKDNMGHSTDNSGWLIQQPQTKVQNG